MAALCQAPQTRAGLSHRAGALRLRRRAAALVEPEENGALLRNMLDMLDGLTPRAVLWVQGEAEGYEYSAESYLARFGAFVRHAREMQGNPELPFLTVQINRCVEGPSEALDRQWGMVARGPAAGALCAARGGGGALR